MPLFDYVCRTCQHGFEVLVSRDAQPACPECQSADVEKQLSRVAPGRVAEGAASMSLGGCGSCGDPRGPGACRLGN